MTATAPVPFQDSRWQADRAAASTPELDETQHLLDEQELGPFRREVELLQMQMQEEEVAVAATEEECRVAEEELSQQRAARMSLTVRLQQQQRAETRHQGESRQHGSAPVAPPATAVPRAQVVASCCSCSSP